jgi:hypothetical protein
MLSLLTVVLVGCDSDAGRSSRYVVRDSAGVKIVENAEYAWPEGRGWRLSAEPSIHIGTQDGDPNQQFAMIHRALKLSDGRIVVANAGMREIRYFDAEGDFLYSSGRRGDGPGEFQALTGMWRLAGDSILTFDRRQQRVSVFGPDGSFVRSFTFSTLAGAPALPLLIGPTRDRRLILRDRPIRPGEITTGVLHDSTFVLRFDLDGVLVDTLGYILERETFAWNEDGAFMSLRAAFGRGGFWALFDNGLYLGSSESYEIGYYASNGSLSRLIRSTQPNQVVTPEDIERYKENLLEYARDPSSRAMWKRIGSDMPYPGTMPAYGSLKADAEGHLWVGVYPPPGEDLQQWTVFTREGVMLGLVETPPGFTIYEIGTDYVLGRWIDELDVQHIQLYELLKD